MTTCLLFARESKLDFEPLWFAFSTSEEVFTNGY
ncbi:hypothetical protein SMB34_02000 [Thalassospira permensis NBRC 106175]|uniref:Uncharacterized protein n=1 Tax=Thalassospira permensis NBRC 106175 TaxID=1353532 RepID=A0ABR4TUJ1_9PROT|nr:hypothetical protein SMB34_02000 [Thalassospira permensis NBRC 106175]